MAAAWEGARTVVAAPHRVAVWTVDGEETCAEPTRPVSSVGLEGDSIFWTDWVEEDRSTAAFEATLGAGGCGAPLLLAGVSAVELQLSQPARLGGRTLALQTSITREFALVELGRDGGISSVAKLDGGARLCGVADGLLVATDRELLHFEADGGVRRVTAFPSPPSATDCNGQELVVSIEGPDASTIVEYTAEGREVSRHQLAGSIGGVGLARRGWVINDGFLRSWEGALLETPETDAITDVWAHGGSLMASLGRGPVLRWRDAVWQPVTRSSEEQFVEVPDGHGGALQLFARGSSFELWESGSQVVTLPRSSFSGTRSLAPRLWLADSCSGDLLLGIEFDGKQALAFRRQGEWRSVRVPVASYLFATVEADQLLVFLDPATVMRRAVVGEGPWQLEEAKLNLPLDVTRALPDARGVIVETPAGIGLLSQGSTVPISPAGTWLLGVSDGWVFWTSGLGISATAIPRASH